MFRLTLTALCAITLSATACYSGPSTAETKPAARKALLLTKSSGFQHSVIARDGDNLAHAETILIHLASKMGIEMEATKNGSAINAENLKNYDLLLFYTSGDLHKPSNDGGDGIPEDGVAALRAWIEQGGGLLGFHSATDTFCTGDGNPVTPYTQIMGAEFAGHGDQFVGNVVVVSPNHLAMKSIPREGWRIADEWYQFRKMNQTDMHVLALLDPGDEREKQPRYNVPAFPIIWCSQIGEGRVYYNGMGHREDVWTDEVFQKSLQDAMKWALGHGPANAEPNWEAVVPTTLGGGDSQ